MNDVIGVSLAPRRFSAELVGLFAALALLLAGPKSWRLLRMRQRAQRARTGRASLADATLLYHRFLDVLLAKGYVYRQEPQFAEGVARTFSCALKPALHSAGKTMFTVEPVETWKSL